MNRIPLYRRPMPFQYYPPYMYRQPIPEKPIAPPASSNEKAVEVENKSKENRHSSPNDNFLFDLFGIKLFSDDVLILSLLFFLYKEEVKDEGLFLALVLLLIS